MKTLKLTLGAAAIAAMCAAVPAMAQVSSGTGTTVDTGTGLMLSPSTELSNSSSSTISSSSSDSMGNSYYSSTTTTTSVLGAPPSTIVATGAYVTPLPPADGYLRHDYERWLRLR